MAETKSEKALNAAKSAAKAASARAKKVAEGAKTAISRGRNALKESKHRRKIEAGEVLVGSVLAGSLDAYDVRLEAGDYRLPAGIPGGVIGLVVGAAMKEPDLEALGLGALAGGAAIFTAEQIREYASSNGGK